MVGYKQQEEKQHGAFKHALLQFVTDTEPGCWAGRGALLYLFRVGLLPLKSHDRQRVSVSIGLTTSTLHHH